MMRWNKREIAATIVVSGAACAFMFSAGMMVPNEPKVSQPQASAEKVELSTPIEALPTPTIDAVPPVSDLEETDPPPRPSKPALGIEWYEDGSWRNLDTGESGCDPAGICAGLPPVPEGTPTTPNGGYYPNLVLPACAQEDSQNCYWDAARMGNGQGQSFVNVDGVYYYAEVGK